MNKKVCTKCNIEKSTTEFHKQNGGKFGVKAKCKVCHNEYLKENKESISKQKKEWYEKNKEYLKEYRDSNKESISKRMKKYYKNNKESILKKDKEYREANKEEISKRNKEYNKNNKEKINKRSKNKRLNNPLYKLTCNIRNLIRISLKNGAFGKNTKTAKILGCSFDVFKQHIEKQFEPWMSWDNHGKYNGEFNFGWDLDHITPISLADTENQAYILSHYTNFQPLCSKINRNIKKDKIM